VNLRELSRSSVFTQPEKGEKKEKKGFYPRQKKKKKKIHRSFCLWGGKGEGQQREGQPEGQLRVLGA